MFGIPPTLGFICPKCHHGMQPVCSACAERNEEEAGREAMREQEARNEHAAALRKIEGYTALLDFFEGATGVSIDVETDVDEGGPTGVYTATLHGVPWLCCDSGQDKSPEAAIKALRDEICRALRWMADEVQP